MKHRRLLIFSLLIVALLVGGCGLCVSKAKRQYVLDRQLIAALIHHDGKQALALVNAGADPNTRNAPPPVPTFNLLLNQLLHRSPRFDTDSPTAFLMACGMVWIAPDRHAGCSYYRQDDAALVRTMLTHGADVRTMLTHNSNDGIVYVLNTSALHWACISKSPNIAQLLLDHGANINAQDEDGRTPLMYAVATMDTRLTRLLLEHGASVSITDQNGANALHHAVASGMKRDILGLLLAHGSDSDQKDRRSKTPLTLARDKHRTDIVVLLRKYKK